jgi:hypothetical protein
MEVIEESLGKQEEFILDVSQIQIKPWRFDYVSERAFLK